jgi:hypothetical protein
VINSKAVLTIRTLSNIVRLVRLKEVFTGIMFIFIRHPAKLLVFSGVEIISAAQAAPVK